MAITQPNRNPYKIQPQRRMEFLLLHSKAGRYDPLLDTVGRRERFENYKKVNLAPASSQDCYACRDQAQQWHHIVHIRNGGDDSKRNLVPVCNACHKRAHRHDVVRGNRRESVYKHIPVLLKPLVVVTYVPPTPRQSTRKFIPQHPCGCASAGY
jgi:5-methylcytosine-specific restriction endonuclease McrA